MSTNNSKSRDQVVKRIVDTLEAKIPGTIILTGAWGTGKTYLWENSIKHSLNGKPVSVSLFGINSSAELKTRIMTEALIATDFSSLKEGSENRWAKVWGNLKSFGKQAGVTGLNVVDNLLGSDIIAIRPEPLDLVPSGTIICIDDLERAGQDLSIVEVLGAANYLLESRKCKLLLILDDTQLHRHSPEYESGFQKYRERLSAPTVRIASDVHQLLSDKLSANIERAIPGSREAIVDALSRPFLTSGHQNLRTVHSTIQALEYVLDGMGEQQIPLGYVTFLSVVSIEASTGSLRPNEFYNFLPSMMAFTDNLDAQAAEQLQFMNRYYGQDYLSYSPAMELVQVFRDGFCNVSSLKKSIYVPSYEELTEAGKLMFESRDDTFEFRTDLELMTFIERATEQITKGADGKHSHVLVLYDAVAMACELLGKEFPSELKTVAETMLRQYVDTRKANITKEDFRTYSMRFRSVQGKALEEFALAEIDQNTTRHGYEQLLESVRSGAISTYIDLLDSKFDNVRYLCEVRSRLDVFEKYSRRHIWFSMLEHLHGKLALATSQSSEELPDLRCNFRQWLSDRMEETKEQSEAFWLRFLLKKTASWDTLGQSKHQ